MQQHADVRLVLALPPGAFRPPPKVRSALVTVRFHPAAPAPLDQPLFERLVQSVFMRRRKTLSNALLAFSESARLAPADALARASIDGRRRPETLGIAELARLADVYATVSPAPGP
ncbi:MAG: hypothetical protein E8D45_00105 [Nitrospira sp.]|nr:MAG: hypothetical protein E8D45_00105 [Nitrospira sp.]